MSVHGGNPRSNCTFMELKLMSSSVSAIDDAVLIVPLWN